MNTLRTIRNYICYCGIEKEEFRVVKKDAYVSNFKIWRILNFFMAAVFGVLFIGSCINDMMQMNRIYYLVLFLYSIVVSVAFLFLKKESIIAQFLIYLSMSMLFLFGCLVSANKPENPATTFIALLLIMPMVMLDKPFFMAIEDTAAAVVYLVWMHGIKTPYVWNVDLINVAVFLIVGIFIHVITNSFRIKEFVLTRKINIQKDTDDITGLKNKGALTRGINEYLQNETKNKGILFILDVDHFKSINDTFGHDIGDNVISQLGGYLKEKFTSDEIVGRFGGDEFIVFIKDTDDKEFASKIANEIWDGTREFIKLPKEDQKISVSMGIAIYHGEEKNYSEIFKKADVAMYKTKENRASKFNFYG